MSEEERRPPERIRVTKLQEAQLADLTRIEHQVAAMYLEAGFEADAIAPRSDIAIAKLTRTHDVLVAEADHHVAGYMFWADQAPGVAMLSALMVAPDFHRFGIATRMLREIGEVASRHGIDTVVTPCWDRASWAMAFLAVRGFQLLDGGDLLPPKLTQWLEKRPDDATVEGQRLWWAKTDGLGTVPGLPRPS